MTPTYVLPVWETVKTAWDKTFGAKKTIWAAFGILILIAFGFGILAGLFSYITTSLGHVINFICQIFIFLLQMGLLYIGIQRAKGMPINYRMIFVTFEWDLAIRLIGLYIVQFVILIIPAIIAGFCVGMSIDAHNTAHLLLMVVMALIALIATLVTIYLSLRLLMGMAFVLDRRLSPIEAVRNSFRATRSNVWALLGVIILEMLIVLVSALPLLIGLIWTLPFAWVLYGEVYSRLADRA